MSEEKESKTTTKQKIMKSRKIKEKSANVYIGALNKIRRTIGGDLPDANENVDFLNNYKKTIEAIDKEKKLTTKKNKLVAVIVALGAQKPKDNDLIEKYSKKLQSMNEEYNKFLKKQEKTETQKKNWIDYNKILLIANAILKDIRNQNIFNKSELSKKEFNLLQEYVILRTYIAFPLRNDFADMKILKRSEYKDLKQDEIKNNNFLVIPDKENSKGGKKFYINQFKNQRFMGSQTLDIPATLSRVIDKWLKYNKSGWFLVKPNRTSPLSPNGITKFLNQLFKKRAEGKKISTSMIRHIIISHMLKDEPTLKEKEQEKDEVEKKFLHTKAMNDLYRKVD